MTRNTTPVFGEDLNQAPIAPQADDPDDDLMTIHEVARRLRVDDTTVRRWINNGVLDAVTLPHLGKRRSYRVRRKTYDNLLQSGTIEV